MGTYNSLPKQDTSPLCDLPVFVRRGNQASLLPGLPSRLMPWFGGHVDKGGPPWIRAGESADGQLASMIQKVSRDVHSGH